MQAYYGCYLLESLKLKHRTYIGFTMDPRRRLRQHNGELTAGAWKTKKGRPWKMVLCVWGFSNKISALQFEYAWQHPAICRHARGAVAHLGFVQRTWKGRQKVIPGVAKNMEVLFQMLQVSPYCRMPLRVHILDDGAYWQIMPSLNAARHLPSHTSVTHGNFDDLEHLCAAAMGAMRCPANGALCVVCKDPLKERDRIVSCPSCEHPFHVCCAAQVFTGATGLCLLPQGSADCPSCKKTTEWPVLVRSARRLSKAPLQKECSEDSDGGLEDDVSTSAEDSPAPQHVEVCRDVAECQLDHCPKFVIDSDEDDEPDVVQQGTGGASAYERLLGTKDMQAKADDSCPAGDPVDPEAALRSRLFKRRRCDSSVFNI